MRLLEFGQVPLTGWHPPAGRGCTAHPLHSSFHTTAVGWRLCTENQALLPFLTHQSLPESLGMLLMVMRRKAESSRDPDTISLAELV